MWYGATWLLQSLLTERERDMEEGVFCRYHWLVRSKWLFSRNTRKVHRNTTGCNSHLQNMVALHAPTKCCVIGLLIKAQCVSTSEVEHSKHSPTSLDKKRFTVSVNFLALEKKEQKNDTQGLDKYFIGLVQCFLTSTNLIEWIVSAGFWFGYPKAVTDWVDFLSVDCCIDCGNFCKTTLTVSCESNGLSL